MTIGLVIQTRTDGLDSSGDRFSKACLVTELSAIGRKLCEIDGREVLILKHGKQIFAFLNRCTHLDYPLENGRLIGFEIICRKHGARFDIRTGAAIGGPAVRSLEIYETRVADGAVQINMPAKLKDQFWPD